MHDVFVHGRAGGESAIDHDRDKAANDDLRVVALERRMDAGGASSPAQPQHRRHRRARAEELWVKVKLGEGMVVARVEDISAGGLFARTQRDVPYGAFVELVLLRPGHDELQLCGVVVADTSRRAGLAVRFELLSRATETTLRQVVLELQSRSAGNDPDVDVTPTSPLAPLSEPRDRELESLRRRITQLQAENERLRAEVADADDAHRLCGRLRLEIDRLRVAVDHHRLVDADIIADLHRDAEVVWVAAARLADAVKKLRG